MEKVEGIIFDLDGTLVDSLSSIAGAMNRLLSRLGYPEHPVETYRYFVGDGIENLIVRAIPGYAGDSADISELVRLYRKEYSRIWPEETSPYPGIPEMLNDLTRKGIKMAVLSNKSEPYTREIVRKILPDWTFNPVHGARPGIPLKPDPTVALEICAAMETGPDRTVFAGDSGIDMETGSRGGMIPVGVLWGFREKDELLSHGAGRVVSVPGNMVKIFE
jgi:phosphoglycolate phosphatase